MNERILVIIDRRKRAGDEDPIGVKARRPKLGRRRIALVEEIAHPGVQLEMASDAPAGSQL
jgi:hypothetical protein